jgi:intraflagellar transport protein 20
MDEDRVVQFDTNGQIRVYDPEAFEEMVKTIESQADYVEKMDQFKAVVGQTMSVVQQLGQAIEKEKLRAIGSRNVAESETENRKRAAREAELRLAEKQAELDRYVAEYVSLQKVELEQRNTIQRLTSGTATD